MNWIVYEYYDDSYFMQLALASPYFGLQVQLLSNARNGPCIVSPDTVTCVDRVPGLKVGSILLYVF